MKRVKQMLLKDSILQDCCRCCQTWKSVSAGNMVSAADDICCAKVKSGSWQGNYGKVQTITAFFSYASCVVWRLKKKEKRKSWETLLTENHATPIPSSLLSSSLCRSFLPPFRFLFTSFPDTQYLWLRTFSLPGHSSYYHHHRYHHCPNRWFIFLVSKSLLLLFLFLCQIFWWAISFLPSQTAA